MLGYSALTFDVTPNAYYNDSKQNLETLLEVCVCACVCYNVNILAVKHDGFSTLNVSIKTKCKTEFSTLYLQSPQFPAQNIHYPDLQQQVNLAIFF